MNANRIVAAIVLVGFASYIFRSFGPLFGVAAVAILGLLAWILARREDGSRYLCDTCKYSYGDVCSRPEKPNATKCPDYKRS